MKNRWTKIQNSSCTIIFIIPIIWISVNILYWSTIMYITNKISHSYKYNNSYIIIHIWIGVNIQYQLFIK